MILPRFFRTALPAALPAGLLLAPAARAELTLPSVFADGMVVQQRASVPVWGWSEPGARVVVTGSWAQDSEPASAVADASGYWRAALATPAAGGPHSIEVAGGEETRTLSDVLVGEVWLCSGQSNMEWELSKTIEAARAAATLPARTLELRRPTIRFFDVPRTPAWEPQRDVDARWWTAEGEDALRCSAVAYHFACELQDALDGIPVGLVVTTWGGTTAQAWTSREVASRFPDHAATLASVAAKAEAEGGAPTVDQRVPSALYNGMIAPVLPYGIRGFLWYQGESNRARADEYGTLFPALIVDWRTRWGSADLPFHLVQLAPFEYGESDAGDRTAIVREAQHLAARDLPHVGMALTADIGDPKDIHPKDKWTVGARLARLALVDPYGRDDVVAQGPTLRGVTAEGNVLRVDFDHVGGRLSVRGDALNHFEIAVTDGDFVPARAEISDDGQSVRLRADGIDQPKRARYLWDDAAEATLMGGAGLPAAPFRTPPSASRGQSK